MPAPESSASKWRILIGPIGLCLILASLSWLTYLKWEKIWIEQSAGFFPPEWKEVDKFDELSWRYPVYRSNDTYQWVHLADSLAQGDQSVLQYRSDEGTLEGRRNVWHSGLARALAIRGKIYAWLKGWPEERGIHQLPHWQGSVFGISCLIIGCISLLYFYGRASALTFALLYYFCAAIQWDFAFSRLDHESIYQVSFILQLIGLIGILHFASKQNSRAVHIWAITAGISAAFGWWISAAMQAVVGVLLMLGALALRQQGAYKAWGADEKQLAASGYHLWGISGAIGILGFMILDQRFDHLESIASLHPIYLLAHLGAAFLCKAAWMPSGRSKKLQIGLSLIAGISPLILIAFIGPAAHPWLDPFMRDLHSWIVEFQSPFTNGIWKDRYSIQGWLVVLTAIAGCCLVVHPRRDLIVLMVGLGLIAVFQGRWLGLLSVVAVLSLSIQVFANRKLYWLVSGLGLFLIGYWGLYWKNAETNPGRDFVADMILQVGARDINLNLNAYGTQEKPVIVAMPFAFSATSALFEAVHPIGTFYWENGKGLSESIRLFASRVDAKAYEIVRHHKIQFLVVQAGGLGRPFATMVTDIEDQNARSAIIDQSLAWRLSIAKDVPSWCEEIPFYGSFDRQVFDVRIYRVRQN